MQPDHGLDDLENQYRNASNLNARITLHSRFSTNRTGWMRWVFGPAYQHKDDRQA